MFNFGLVTLFGVQNLYKIWIHQKVLKYCFLIAKCLT
jgi:hypothetical protein